MPALYWLECRYTDSQNLFDRRHDFDGVPESQDKQIFASEFAVVNDPAGSTIPFPGNARVSKLATCVLTH